MVSPLASQTQPFAGTLGRSRGMKVYTRTGDKGQSSLYTGERRRKNDDVFHALGDVDELNAYIGIAREHCRAAGNTPELTEHLDEIQCRLMDVGSHLATPRSDEGESAKMQRTKVQDAWVARLEQWIDAMDSDLPPLKNFILPSGGPGSSALHLARTVCRRAERTVVPLVESGVADGAAGRYLNRLSDFLFVAARYACAKGGYTETVWRKDA